jgi:glycosyltransferase involved in cell wall biosynthesis
MRSLHVAALPFPSPQGTQGLLHAMLGALAEAGHATHLACYGYGAREPAARSYPLHRLPYSLGVRSLRSGPGLRKLALDVALAGHVGALVRTLAPDVVIAHHVEAALACRLARVPFVFFAHTSLCDELPSYFSDALAMPLARAGAAIDRSMCQSARLVLAVAPALAARLQAATRVEVQALSVPWSVPAPITEPERDAARAQLGFAPDQRVLLYAGNLDAYQGLSQLAQSVRALAREGGWRWLIATESDRASCAALRDPQLPLCFASLANERDRRLVHAAADVVAVPRASPGGLPIKLLDALARGARVVTTRHAAAGHDLVSAGVVMAEEDDPLAFARACVAQLGHSAADAARTARAYIGAEHSAAGFVAQLVSALARIRRSF